MSRRPTEASWDSDDELLGEENTAISAFPTRKDSEDELDEDFLLGGSDDEFSLPSKGKQAETKLDIQNEEIKKKEAEDIQNEQQKINLQDEGSRLDSETIEFAAEQELRKEDNRTINEKDAISAKQGNESTKCTEKTTNDNDIDDLVEPDIIDINEVGNDFDDSEEYITESQDHVSSVIHVEKPREIDTEPSSKEQDVSESLEPSENINDSLDKDVLSHDVESESSESESDDEDSHRERFKSERHDIVKIAPSVKRDDIPDTLEISAEEQEKIDTFMHSRRGRGFGRGNKHQGGARGMGRGHSMGFEGGNMTGVQNVRWGGYGMASGHSMAGGHSLASAQSMASGHNMASGHSMAGHSMAGGHSMASGHNMAGGHSTSGVQTTWGTTSCAGPSTAEQATHGGQAMGRGQPVPRQHPLDTLMPPRKQHPLDQLQEAFNAPTRLRMPPQPQVLRLPFPFRGPRKVLINPHFRGTVTARANARLMWDNHGPKPGMPPGQPQNNPAPPISFIGSSPPQSLSHIQRAPMMSQAPMRPGQIMHPGPPFGPNQQMIGIPRESLLHGGPPPSRFPPPQQNQQVMLGPRQHFGGPPQHLGLPPQHIVGPTQSMNVPPHQGMMGPPPQQIIIGPPPQLQEGVPPLMLRPPGPGPFPPSTQTYHHQSPPGQGMSQAHLSHHPPPNLVQEQQNRYTAPISHQFQHKQHRQDFPNRREQQSSMGKNRLKDNIKQKQKSIDGITIFFNKQAPLSNFYPCHFELNDQTYNSVEQYYQQQKALIYGNKAIASMIMQERNPAFIKKLSHKLKPMDNNQWNELKVDVMYRCVHAKFEQNPALTRELLHTEDVIGEASPNDLFWGIGLGLHDPDAFEPDKWRGLNHLGTILMDVRRELRLKGDIKHKELKQKSIDGVTIFFNKQAPLSNFYPCHFELHGQTYNSVEQYYQQQKALIYDNKAVASMIMQTRNPAFIKKLSHKLKPVDNNEWDELKVEVMYRCVHAKFEQNPTLKRELMDTEDIIGEASPNDLFWGIGLGLHNPNAFEPDKWRGLNNLGKILMDVRRELRKKKRPQHSRQNEVPTKKMREEHKPEIPMDPETRELQEKIKQQKKLREAFQRKKEARRQAQAGQRRQELKERLSSQGLENTESKHTLGSAIQTQDNKCHGIQPKTIDKNPKSVKTAKNNTKDEANEAAKRVVKLPSTKRKQQVDDEAGPTKKSRIVLSKSPAMKSSQRKVLPSSRTDNASPVPQSTDRIVKMPTSTVILDNLSSVTSEKTLRNLSETIGDAQKIKLDASNRSAQITFKQPRQAILFMKKYNRSTLDKSQITITLVKS